MLRIIKLALIKGPNKKYLTFVQNLFIPPLMRRTSFDVRQNSADHEFVCFSGRVLAGIAENRQ